MSQARANRVTLLNANKFLALIGYSPESPETAATGEQ